ncbi:MAG: galactose-1-epimerase, partial [Pseudomonadota bacterium]
MSLASHWLTHDDTCIHILARGASLRVWQVAGENAILGYEDPAAYATNPYYLGALVGRVANRIAGATFPLAGEEVRIPPNEGSNLLHGGADGLSSRLFKLIPNGPRHARLTYTSPPGEGGFPGQAAITVDLHLENRTLFYAITATVDRPTPISIAQHVYYALGGAPVLTLPARRYLPVDADGMPDRPMPLRSSLIDGLRLD